MERWHYAAIGHRINPRWPGQQKHSFDVSSATIAFRVSSAFPVPTLFFLLFCCLKKTFRRQSVWPSFVLQVDLSTMKILVYVGSGRLSLRGIAVFLVVWFEVAKTVHAFSTTGSPTTSNRSFEASPRGKFYLHSTPIIRYEEATILSTTIKAEHTTKTSRISPKTLLGISLGAWTLLSEPAQAANINPISLRNGFLGGSLIGTASAVALLGAGEVMGFSGIIGPLFKNPVQAAKDPTQKWKFTFLSTFLLSSYLFFLPWADTARITSVACTTSPVAYALSGLLVGFGTKMGNGCTSGHGIAGLARLARRSIVAVATFMSWAVLTTIITSPQQPTGRFFSFLRNGAVESYAPSWIMPTFTALWLGLTLVSRPWKLESSSNNESNVVSDNSESRKWIPAALSGLLAGAGLSMSSMVYPAAIRSFLDVANTSTWDPTLMMVMMGGLAVSFTAYQFVPRHAILAPNGPKLDKPWAGSKFGVPTNQVIDKPLVIGAAMFGMGWGLTGLCPGPALLLATTGLSGMLLQWWPAFSIGTRLAEFTRKYL